MSVGKAMGRPEGQREEWSLERDRYLILLHMYNLGPSVRTGSLTAEKIARDLAFTAARTELIVGTLIDFGLIQQSIVGGGLDLSPAGTRYIEREAGRRRSVRLLR